MAYDVTVCIPHVDSFPLLRSCLRHVKHFQDPRYSTQVLVADQSNDNVHDQVRDLCSKHEDVKLMRFKPISHGHALDMGVREADGEYLVTLDCDAMPIHKNWLHVPIQLVKRGYCMVGNCSGLQIHYRDLGNFTVINNWFRAMKTDVARELSRSCGFMRPEDWRRAGFNPVGDLNWPEGRNCDNGVIANMYAERKGMGNKLSLRLSGHLGRIPKGWMYGIIIEDLVLHMVFCNKISRDLGKDFFRDLMVVTGGSVETVLDLVRNEANVLSGPVPEDQRGSPGEPHACVTSVNGKSPTKEILKLIEDLKAC